MYSQVHPSINETLEFVVSGTKMQEETVLVEVFDASSKDGIGSVSLSLSFCHFNPLRSHYRRGRHV
jgi:hypothetical protein